MNIEILKEILGEDGALALNKAAERSPILKSLLIPQTILSWINTIVGNHYEGSIPGVPNSYILLEKSESKFDGAVTINDIMYDFNKSELFHVVAAIGVSLGASTINPGVDAKDIEKLSKCIDLFVKHKALSKELIKKTEELEKKLLDPALGYKITHQHHDLGDEQLTQVNVHDNKGNYVGGALFTHKGDKLDPEGVKVHPDHQRRGIASAVYAHAEKVTGKRVTPSHDQTPAGKALWSGNMKAPQFGKSSKELKINNSMLSKKCNDCGTPIFKGNKITGCPCIQEMLKSSGAKVDKNILKFKNIDDETFEFIVKILGE